MMKSNEYIEVLADLVDAVVEVMTR